MRAIAFPVLGPVRYQNGWGDCRDGCTRRHEGTDMIGVRMQPLLAAVDGTLTRVRHDNVGKAGAILTVTGTDGWSYNYFHVNNDDPGTDDGGARSYWQVPPHLSVGSHVQAGQVIGYMGDSGNAEGSVPHLHFEIRTPDRTPVNPYPSLVAAAQQATCALPVGASPDANALAADAVAIIPLGGGGRWLIDRQGHLFAEGEAAQVAPSSARSCDSPAITPLPAPAAAVDAAPQTLEFPAIAEPPPAEPTSAATTPDAPTASEPTTPARAEPAVAPREWRVERGQSLWHIVQRAYGVSDTPTTVSLVEAVFAQNHAQLSDPDVLPIGATLELPARAS